MSISFTSLLQLFYFTSVYIPRLKLLSCTVTFSLISRTTGPGSDYGKSQLKLLSCTVTFSLISRTAGPGSDYGKSQVLVVTMVSLRSW